MAKRMTAAALDFLVLAGFVGFFIFQGFFNLWLLPFSLFMLARLSRPKKFEALGQRRFFLPFASGLLVWPMRLFYWDQGDFAARVQNLLLLASLFAVWSLLRQGRWARRFLLYFNRLSLKKRLLAVFIGAELLFILAAGMITSRNVALVGDEPHYLAISQSLARDGDLNVFNQYFRGGFKEFLRVEKLAAHGTWGKGFKKIYSYHLPGISLTLAPFFFFKLSPPLLYFLLRSYLGLFGALLAVLIYLFCLRLWRSRSLAFFATLVFSLTAPVFFYSFHIFPEVQAMLLVLSALYLMLFKANGKSSRCLWAGLLLGAAIFWGVKYALFIYPISLGFCAYWLWKKRYRPALLLVVFPLLFQALFFCYLYGAYGSFSPNSVYYGMLSPEQSQAFYDTILKKITLNQRWETLLDYFFDQRDGLLLYNPFYFFAFPGLLLALKKFKRYRWHLLAALPALLFVLNHSFSTIRAGFCPQGRYLTPVAWALLLFALVYYRESRNRVFKKAFLALPLYGLFVSAYQTALPFTLYQPTTHDSLVRTGLLFQNWSNIFIPLPSLLPSYIKTDNRGYLPNWIFLAIFLLLIILSLGRGRSRHVRGAPVLVFLGIFALGCLFPRPDLSAGREMTDRQGRSCRLYMSPEAKEQNEAQTWMLGGSRTYGILLETRQPLAEIVLNLENNSRQSPWQISISEFDSQIRRQELNPGEALEVRLRRPFARKFNRRFYYHLHLEGKAVAGGTEPAGLLHVACR